MVLVKLDLLEMLLTCLLKIWVPKPTKAMFLLCLLSLILLMGHARGTQEDNLDITYRRRLDMTWIEVTCHLIQAIPVEMLYLDELLTAMLSHNRRLPQVMGELWILVLVNQLVLRLTEAQMTCTFWTP